MDDTYSWLYQVIESCKSDVHFKGADLLITLFSARFRDSEKIKELQVLRQNRWRDVHSIGVKNMWIKQAG